MHDAVSQPDQTRSRPARLARGASRRAFLKRLASTGAAALAVSLLGACSSPPPAAKPAETKPAESKPAAQPTQAAAPAAQPAATKPAEAKPAEAAKPTESKPVAAAPASKGSVQIGMWAFPLTQDDAAMFKPMVEAFQKENPNITVDVQILPWTGRAEKMIASLAANQPPDVVYLNPDFYPRFVEANELVALDPLLPGGYRDDFLPGALDAVTYDNKTFGLPILTSMYANAYNTDLYTAAGLDVNKPPTSWEEFLQALEAMTKPREGQVGAFLDMKRPSPVTTFVPIMWQAGGEMYSDDGKSVRFNEPPGVEALEFMVSIFKNGYAQQANITGGGLPFSSGKVGVIVQAEPNVVKKAQTDAPNIKIGIMPTLKRQRQINFGTVGSYAVFAKSKSHEQSAKWITHITSPATTTEILSKSGFISPRKSIKPEAYATDPVFQKIIAEAQYARSEPKHVEARPVFDAMMPEIEAALLGQKPAKAALDAAAEASNKLLAK
jgi:multiple sugar transport system substrate-binding protein